MMSDSAGWRGFDGGSGHSITLAPVVKTMRDAQQVYPCPRVLLTHENRTSLHRIMMLRELC
jgi:hypothetical protein